MFALALVALTQPTVAAHAYTATVSVRWGGICSIPYDIRTNGGVAGGVKFNLGSSTKSRYLTLATSNSWGWAKDDNGLPTPYKWANQYHVRFLDANGKNVWTEYRAIPNGGQRRFHVGTNVRSIIVFAGPGVNAFGYYMSPVVPARVSYIS